MKRRNHLNCGITSLRYRYVRNDKYLAGHDIIGDLPKLKYMNYPCIKPVSARGSSLGNPLIWFMSNKILAQKMDLNLDILKPCFF